jgi:hypothetical protein
MCASLLRQLGIKKVFFGAVNDKFGGTGGVFSIHKNADQPKDLADQGFGDGGNIETGFAVEGGWGRDEAVALLRRFYVQENGRGKFPSPSHYLRRFSFRCGARKLIVYIAPVPRKKEGRAARLAALEMEGSTAGDHALRNLDIPTGGTPTEEVPPLLEPKL